MTLWSNEDSRIAVARRMYAMRLGELLPQRDLNALRGIEGQRMKAVYQQLADHYGVKWTGRRYDRARPEETNTVNMALNHAAVAVRSAAMIAVASTGAIPQLGFIHEASGLAFSLDIADLYRTDVTIPVAFQAARKLADQSREDVERVTRRLAGTTLRKEKVVGQMIDSIKRLLDGDDDSGNS